MFCYFAENVTVCNGRTLWKAQTPLVQKNAHLNLRCVFYKSRILKKYDSVYLIIDAMQNIQQYK